MIIYIDEWKKKRQEINRIINQNNNQKINQIIINYPLNKCYTAESLEKYFGNIAIQSEIVIYSKFVNYDKTEYKTPIIYTRKCCADCKKILYVKKGEGILVCNKCESAREDLLCRISKLKMWDSKPSITPYKLYYNDKKKTQKFITVDYKFHDYYIESDFIFKEEDKNLEKLGEKLYKRISPKGYRDYKGEDTSSELLIDDIF